MLDRIRIINYIGDTVKHPKRPRDPNQLAKTIADLATGEVSESLAESKKNPHAVELGRLGGLKGGNARAKKLSKARRSKIAKKAANARWHKRSKKKQIGAT